MATEYLDNKEDHIGGETNQTEWDKNPQNQQNSVEKKEESEKSDKSVEEENGQMGKFPKIIFYGERGEYS